MQDSQEGGLVESALFFLGILGFSLGVSLLAEFTLKLVFLTTFLSARVLTGTVVSVLISFSI